MLGILHLFPAYELRLLLGLPQTLRVLEPLPQQLQPQLQLQSLTKPQVKMSSRQPDQGRSTGQQGRGQSSRGQRAPRPPVQGLPNDWHSEQQADPLASLYSGVQQAKQRLIERQQGQKREQKNARAVASDTNRQGQGKRPYAAGWAQEDRSRVFREENPDDLIYDPGPPDPRNWGSDEYEDQMGQHEDAQSAKERIDSQTLTDYNERKPRRSSIGDFTEREAGVIRERSGHQRLQEQKTRDSEREFRTPSFPYYPGGRMG